MKSASVAFLLTPSQPASPNLCSQTSK